MLPPDVVRKCIENYEKRFLINDITIHDKLEFYTEDNIQVIKSPGFGIEHRGLEYAFEPFELMGSTLKEPIIHPNFYEIHSDFASMTHNPDLKVLSSLLNMYGMGYGYPIVCYHALEPKKTDGPLFLSNECFQSYLLDTLKFRYLSS